MPDVSDNDTGKPNSEDNVIRRMLASKPKPLPKPGPGRQRGRPIGGGGSR